MFSQPLRFQRHTMMGFVVAVAVTFISPWPLRCFGDANPVAVSLPVYYRNTAGGTDVSTSYSVTVTETNGKWLPQNTGWNDYDTSLGNPIENVVSPAGFPFTAGPDTVTADKCKYYWDAYLPGWTYVSGATCATNCYAYATGGSVWINPGGFNVLMQDDYTINTTDYCAGGCVLKQSGDHAQKLSACCGCKPDTIKTVIQKVNSSPVYSITVSCPPGDKQPYSTIYCSN